MFRIIIFILLFSNLSAAKDNGNIKLEPIGKVYVKGEPLYFRFVGYNLSNGNYLDGKPCVGAQYIIVVPEKLEMGEDDVALKGKEKVKKQIKEVVFLLQNICDLRIKDMVAKRYELCHEEENVKVCTEFEIKEPEGVDKEVFEKYIKPLDWDIIHNIQDNFLDISNDILGNYPTSTYAGWVWPPVGASFGYWSGKELIDDMLKPVSERRHRGSIEEDKNGNRYLKSAEEIAIKFIKYSNAFLSANENHINAGIIYSKQALAYMVLNRWKEAYISGKKSLELKWPEFWYSYYPPNLEKERRILKEALQELLNRGFVKEE